MVSLPVLMALALVLKGGWAFSPAITGCSTRSTLTSLESLRSRIPFMRAGEGSEDTASKTNRQGVPQKPIGTELFDKEYVPSGLTKEQYASIRKQEAEEEAKKDYGAWGPRFLKGSRPEGDWMVMPSLWTGGYDSNSKNAVVSGDKPSGARTVPSTVLVTIVSNFRRLAPALALQLILLWAVTASRGVTRSATDSSSAGAVLARLLVVPWRSALALVRGRAKLAVAFTTAAITAALPLSAVLSRVTEWSNRRHLWSHRRTLLTIMLAPVGIVLSYASVMSGLVALR